MVRIEVVRFDRIKVAEVALVNGTEPVTIELLLINLTATLPGVESSEKLSKDQRLR